MSNEIPKIYAAINSIMSEVEAVPKGQKNAQQGYQYRGIDDFFAALHPLLAKHKVFVTKKVLGHNREEKISKSGTALQYSIIEIEFSYHAEDGSTVSDTAVGEAMDSGDKASNKAMATAFKYSLMQVFAIPTKETKDTEAESHEVKPGAAKQPESRTGSGTKEEAASDKQKELIEKLLKSHVFEGDESADKIRRSIPKLTKNRASDAIEWIQKELKTRKELEALADEYINAPQP